MNKIKVLEERLKDMNKVVLDDIRKQPFTEEAEMR